MTDDQTPAAPVETPAGSFLSKLKEQSFSILVMVCVVYYQHTLWQADRSRMEIELTRRVAQVDAMVEAERGRLVEREKYLMTQRDAFVDMLKGQAALCRMRQKVDAE